MQGASQTDDEGGVTRARQRDRVILSRTKAFASLLLLIVVWTMFSWYYRSHLPTANSPLPSDWIVDLNHATQAELNLLPGVGDKLAGDILKYREEKGPFQSVEELMNIRGIKEGRLLSLRKYLRVNNQDSSPQETDNPDSNPHNPRMRDSRNQRIEESSSPM